MPGKQVAGLKRPAKKKAEARRPKLEVPSDPQQTLIDNVVAAVKSGRYLVIVAHIDSAAPRGKELKTRHHTRNFPSGDFTTACDVERPKFFRALHS